MEANDGGSTEAGSLREQLQQKMSPDDDLRLTPHLGSNNSDGVASTQADGDSMRNEPSDSHMPQTIGVHINHHDDQQSSTAEPTTYLYATDVETSPLPSSNMLFDHSDTVQQQKADNPFDDSSAMATSSDEPMVYSFTKDQGKTDQDMSQGTKQQSSFKVGEPNVFDDLFSQSESAGVGSDTTTTTDACDIKLQPNTGESTISTDGGEPIPTTAPASYAIHRTSSTPQRRRHRGISQMESISESPWDATTNNRRNTTGCDDDDDIDASDANDDFSDTTTIQSTHSHDAISATASISSTPTRRRRAHATTDVTGSIAGGSLDRHLRRGTQFRRDERRRLRRESSSPANAAIDNTNRESGDTDDEDNDRRRQRNNNGNSLVASLDAGMASLRRWIRSRRVSFNSGGGAGSSSGQSVSSSSFTAIRLGEEDFAALSYAGSDPRGIATTASSISSNSNSNSGYLYYRPTEVQVDPNNEVDTIYGSDDESGTNSVLLPLVPSSPTTGDRQSQQNRQRAFSEPDRARLADFFSSVYGSRAIDGRRLRGRRSVGRQQSPEQSTSQRRVGFARAPSPMTIEEETDVLEEEHDYITEEETNQLDNLLRSPLLSEEQPLPSTIEMQEIPLSASTSSDVEASPVPAVVSTLTNTGNSANALPDDETPAETDDPNRRARSRWIRINRRFQFTINLVALLFSLLLFTILVCWVLLITTYVISLEKVLSFSWYWLCRYDVIHSPRSFACFA